MKRRFSATVAILAAVLSGGGLKAHAADDPAVARIDGADVKASEIKGLLDELPAADRSQILRNRQVLVNFVRAELGRRAVLQEARSRKWDQRPDVIAWAERAKTDVILATYLNSVAVNSVSEPTDDQLRQVYNANLSRFMQPREYHLAQIVVLKPAGATPGDLDTARQKAVDIAKRAKANPAGFPELAKASSDDKQTGAKGGDIGFLPETNLAPDFASAVRTLSDNDVSAPIEAKDGWHILHEIATKPAGPRPFDEVKPTLVSLIRQEETNRAEKLYADKVLASKNAAVNEIELAKISESAANP